MKELIAIGVTHTTRCPYCIEGHVRAAKKAGTTDQEIAEAIFIASDSNRQIIRFTRLALPLSNLRYGWEVTVIKRKVLKQKAGKLLSTLPSVLHNLIQPGRFAFIDR